MSQTNKTPPPSPVLPLPPLEYDIAYMNNLVRLLNYFITQQNNPGSVQGAGLRLYQSVSPYGDTVLATNIKARQGYQIKTVGTTNFTTFGASSNTVGIYFVAMINGSAGSGTGDVYVVQNSAGLPVPVSATLIEANKQYTIITVGTTNYVALGASSNTIGIRFTANGAGSGTGTVLEAADSGTVWCDPSDSYTLKILP